MDVAAATSPEIDVAADVRPNLYVELEEIGAEVNIERRSSIISIAYL